MTWDNAVHSLIEDLEQQAEGLALAERDLEVSELSAAEYARVDLAARLRASLSAEVQLRLLSGVQVRGELSRVGEDWLLVVDHASDWVIPQTSILGVSGLSSRARPAEAASVVHQLSIRAVLRRLAASLAPCVVHFGAEQQVEGRLGRVGQDFVELHVGETPRMEVVPLRGVAAFQGRR